MILEETDNKQYTLFEAQPIFKNYFLNDSAESTAAYRKIVSEVAASIANQLKKQHRPYNGKSPASLKKEIEAFDLFPETGNPLETVFNKTKSLLIESNILVYHPHCVAHLHCPAFIASLAAEMIISAFNQSMDSWDQSPAATLIEQALCDQFCSIYGLGPSADAVFTSGGTMSNFMGMLLARDRFSQQHFQWNIQEQGLPPQASTFRILCSAHAHFSISQSAAILGLGQAAVVPINEDGFDEEVSALTSKIKQLKKEGLLPIAYVSTAGTTNFGSIGAIAALADCAHQHGLWVHVDAAYGGALMFSAKHKHTLQGIEKADSVTVDFHKLFYQPIPCGIFMVKDKSSFEAIRMHTDYLNPQRNMDMGLLDLVYKSIQTTRRFDALKLFITLQHVGVKKLGEMLDYTIGLAEAVSLIIEQEPQLELAYKTPINTVVFRYVPEENHNDQETNAINHAIKAALLFSGKAVIGQTNVHHRSFLKFTLLNPMTGIQDIALLLDKIKELGKQFEKQTRNQLQQPTHSFL